MTRNFRSQPPVEINRCDSPEPPGESHRFLIHESAVTPRRFLRRYVHADLMPLTAHPRDSGSSATNPSDCRLYVRVIVEIS